MSEAGQFFYPKFKASAYSFKKDHTARKFFMVPSPKVLLEHSLRLDIPKFSSFNLASPAFKLPVNGP